MSSKDWEQQQRKTFTNWVNSHLKKQDLKLEDLATDFDDGILLIKLIEIMSASSLGKYDAKPRMPIHKVQNLNLALSFINNFVASAGIKTKYAAESVMAHDIRQILGMIWVLIHKFEINDISEGDLSSKEGLLLWCQKSVNQGYPGVHVQNFSTSFNDGLAFSALINRYRPDLLDFKAIDPADRLGNLQRAFQIADEKLGIPALLDPQDLFDLGETRADEKSVMTQVSYYWRVFAASKKNELAVRRINRALQRLLANEAVQAEYESRATAFVDWINAKVAELSGSFDFSSLLAIQNVMRTYNDYKIVEKPSKASEKAELDSKLTTLRTKQEAELSPLYSPPAALSTSAINALWTKLSEAEGAFEGSLREAQLREIKLSFDAFDKDKSDSLTKPEFKAALAALGEDVTDQELDRVFQENDQDGDGLLSFNEYASFMLKRLEEKDSFDDLVASFQLLAGGASTIPEATIRAAISPELAEVLVQRAGKEGVVDYKEFARKMYQ